LTSSRSKASESAGELFSVARTDWVARLLERLEKRLGGGGWRSDFWMLGVRSDFCEGVRPRRNSRRPPETLSDVVERLSVGGVSMPFASTVVQLAAADCLRAFWRSS
jgi:hypothetical protein